jgi:hypothetical protein
VNSMTRCPRRETDNEHRLIDARKFNDPHHAAQDRLEALSQFAAPVRAHEDMHGAIRRTLFPSRYIVPSTRPVMPHTGQGSNPCGLGSHVRNVSAETPASAALRALGTWLG